MGIDRSRKQKQKRKERAFFSIPTSLLNAPHFRNLSPRAVKLFLHMAGQYNGHNNGKLTAVYLELLKGGGFKAPKHIKPAKDELVAAGLIKQTAISNRRTQEPDRYAITFKPVDWTADMEETAIEPP